MLNDFLLSFRVKNAYTVNQWIYAFQRIPLLGKLIPDQFYKYKAFKVISTILTIIRQLIVIFGYKLLYIFSFIIFPISFYQADRLDLFLHIYFFLAVLGSFSNTEIFNPTKDKYYMLVLMKMNAKNHTISNFLYFLASTFVGQLTAILILGYGMVPWYYAILLVTITIMLKFIAINFYFYRMKKKKKVMNENKPDSWLLYFSMVGLCLGLAYGLPYFHLIMSKSFFFILSIILLILGILSIKKVFTYPHYEKLYKALLNQDHLFMNTNEVQKNTLIEANSKQISVDKSITSTKEGFAYFHDLFVKRHRKLLSESAKKKTMWIFAIGFGFLILLFLQPHFKEIVRQFILNYLPFVLLFMYFINTGKAVTNAMFVNCDHSMLSYRFFRQPKTILSLFKERLKTLILLNLPPAFAMSIVLSILLAVSGGTSFSTYVVIFFSIIAMSIFFSVHNLVLYYLLQPYSIGMEMKSMTYNIASFLTYWICYYISDLKVSSFLFGFLMIVFAILYSLISLYLVYTRAPKTFKLR